MNKVLDILWRALLLPFALGLMVFTILFLALCEICGGQWTKYLDEWELHHDD